MISEKKVPGKLVKKEDGTIVVLAAFPGFSKEDLKIEVKNSKLFVRTKEDYKEPEPAKDETILHSSLDLRPFKLFLDVPSELVDVENISVKYNSNLGLYTFTLPPKEKEIKKEISITEEA